MTELPISPGVYSTLCKTCGHPLKNLNEQNRGMCDTCHISLKCHGCSQGPANVMVCAECPPDKKHETATCIFCARLPPDTRIEKTVQWKCSTCLKAQNTPKTVPKKRIREKDTLIGQLYRKKVDVKADIELLRNIMEEEPNEPNNRVEECQKKYAECTGDMSDPKHVQDLIDCLGELKTVLEASKKRESIKNDLARLEADLKKLKEELKKLTR